MQDVWNRIQGAVEKGCPEFDCAWKPGVAPESWADFEAEIGEPLPDSLKAFYAIHNGGEGYEEPVVNFLFSRWRLNSQEDLIARWEGWHEIVEECETLEELQEDFDDCISVTPGAIKEQYACDGWIPFGTDDSGNCIGIDLDPDPNGTKGQVITFGSDTAHKHVLAKNFEDFLNWYVTQIETGKVVLVEEDPPRFEYQVPEGEEENIRDGAAIARACSQDLGFL